MLKTFLGIPFNSYAPFNLKITGVKDDSFYLSKPKDILYEYLMYK